MKKIIFVAFVFSLFALSEADAGVTFLPDTAGDYNNFSENSGGNVCQKAGYMYRREDCSGKVYDRCPYGENYYKNCCDQGQKYTVSECKSQGKQADLESVCNGYYRCIDASY